MLLAAFLVDSNLRQAMQLSLQFVLVGHSNLNEHEVKSFHPSIAQ